MIAERSDKTSSAGILQPDLHKSLNFLIELIDFIYEQLPHWRDDPERPRASAETVLTDHLCDFLTVAARRSKGWDVLQFRTEVSDSVMAGRKIDLVAKPCGEAIWVGQRRHTKYDSLIPIECKRLPTPVDPRRDAREYVISDRNSTGGIQRFKAGDHGGGATTAAMIAYVQEDTIDAWFRRIYEWIGEIVIEGRQGWSAEDRLHLERANTSSRQALLCSAHARAKGLSKISLRHLWIEMS